MNIWVLAAIVLAPVMGIWLYGERGRPLRASTWRMMRTAGLRRFLNLSGLHGYIYGRWIKEYIGFLMNVVYPRVGKGGRKWLTDHYHGKVLPLELAEAIVQVDRDIPLHDLEHVIPYPVARDLVLKSPPDIAVFQCGCRQNRAEPCEPVEVCMVIGQPFVDFVLDHHPQSSRALTQEEALNLLQAEHERGHMHTAWFKDAAMDRFYAICNCCRCCCGGLEAMTRYGARSLTSSGYVAQVDAELCSGCATCADLCSFDAIQVNGSSAISWEECMGCGVCVGHCPSEAMSLVLDERKGTPLDVRLMLPELQPA